MSKVTAKVDIRKLERSIKQYAAKLGESNAQAVIRWSVQTCLEIAKYNQPFNGNQKMHRLSILKDISNCIITSSSANAKGKTALKTPQEIIDWVNLNRTLKGRRVPKLPIGQKKRASKANVNRVIKDKMTRAGMARGAWIGAGNAIGSKQRGSNRVSIGVNRFKFAQKHTSKGTAKPPIAGFRSVAIMKNLVKHSGNDYVLRQSHIMRAIADGRIKCLNFYRRSVKAISNK
jgi:hypothetical protein